jgi:predicted nucleic acid-binding protein
MAYLSDTNILLRWQRPTDPLYPVAQQAVKALQRRGERLYVTPQNYIEFWGVATRPASVNGLGMTPAEADAELAHLERFFLLAPDDPAIYGEWRRLVISVGVSGAQVHDARLVAVMRVHGLTHLLTFNPRDFTRYPGITVVRLQDIANVP